MVTTIAGNGTAILATNNSLAATGSIGAIRGLAAPADGSLYFAECAPNLVATPMCFVERIRNGRIELVAGSVRESLDDGPTTEVRLDRGLDSLWATTRLSTSRPAIVSGVSVRVG